MWAKRTGQKGLNAGKYISVSLALSAGNPRCPMHWGKRFHFNDVISCARRLIPSQSRMLRWYNRFLYGNLEMHLSQIWKKIMKQFHKGKFISIYHLERGTILSRPQSIATETWLPFQVCKFSYLIQISPEVRNEIENVVFKIEVTLSLPQRVNTSRHRQYGRYFADHDFKFIFKYDNCICKNKTNSKIYIKMSSAK